MSRRLSAPAKTLLAIVRRNTRAGVLGQHIPACSTRSELRAAGLIYSIPPNRSTLMRRLGHPRAGWFVRPRP